MIELILHIGMGKTGTTSIQYALGSNHGCLSRQRTQYLGLWFDLIDPRFSGDMGHEAFGALSEAEMRRAAGIFVKRLERLRAESGITRFIISNEAIYGLTEENCTRLADHFAPFIATLRKHLKVRIIVYVRDPYDWLPSAYTQWGIHHKIMRGPVRPYGELARALVGTYAGLLRWKHHHPDLLEVRRFDKSIDVVDDFCSTVGIELENAQDRVLERSSVPESVFRFVFNSGFEEEAVPERFDIAMGGLSLSNAPTLHEVICDGFCYRETADILEDNRQMFSSIRDSIGIDFLSGPLNAELPKEGPVRERLVEQLVYVVAAQSDRIASLEAAVEKLKGRRGRRVRRLLGRIGASFPDMMRTKTVR
ncbi:hypothetical protein NVS89_14970 [Ancylobacter sp. MQZ15Z-1]|uniref:Sulfotransferase domain-containing protein n=1 Tax=Ancylobacter mangrovi TaxID=2972472 RepID=A0A9X2PEG4_9HYPH|nr:hypothetical protein [Ancylobacter mangrovi]MCS0496405.1 hypothetical protein [Ancylobacter mangrovi]